MQDRGMGGGGGGGGGDGSLRNYVHQNRHSKREERESDRYRPFFWWKSGIGTKIHAGWGGKHLIHPPSLEYNLL